MRNSCKRALDLFCVLIGVTLLAPLLILIGVAILIDDGRPIFFVQQRVGRWRRPFWIIKFRTMRSGEVTSVGYWLRQTGLDELAQILNILSGEMSVVGPRPLTEFDIDRLGWNDVVVSQRWSVKPGLTGVAQVRGGQGAQASLDADLRYVSEQSISLDTKLILLSVAINMLGKRRVRRWLLK